MNDPLSDSLARQRASTALSTTFLVEAGAGTGKTSVLLQRLLALVRSGRGPLDRMVAITFTEKAATELRVRLRGAIETTLSAPLSEEEQRSLYSARFQLEHAYISTVHAFCAALLRERPVEARVDPDFLILNEARASQLRTEAWHEWLAQEMDRSPTVLKQAFRAGLTLGHLETLRDFLVEHRDCLHMLPAPVAFALSEYQAPLKSACTRLFSLSAACTNPADRALSSLHSLAELLPGSDDEILWERLFLQELSLNSAGGTKANWRPATALEEVRAELRRVHKTHSQARALVTHNLTVALTRWLAGFLQAYDEKKQEQNGLDFTDLLIRTRDLLAHHLEARRYFQDKFDFLLVDEFQDTDPLQAEIVFFLAERTPRAADWTAVELQPGKLFLVGDPQQSIYRFRRADLGIYAQVRQVIERQGEILSLSSNFRSRAPVLAWINETFAREFAAATTDQPSYRVLTAVRQEDTGREVVFLPVPDDLVPVQAGREELRQAEARTVAAFLKQSVVHPGLAIWGDRKIRYSDIAILFRTYQAMESYEAALKTVGVPYRVTGGRRYTNRQEIMELRSLLRAIASPADTPALVATLRSSVFGFSDEELAHFVSEGGQLHYLSPQVPPSILSAAHFHAAFALLRDLHARHTQLTPATLLYDIYARTHVLPFFALRPHGTQRVTNLLKLIDIAHTLAGQGYVTLAAFNRFLDQQDAAALEEEPVTLEDQEETVRLLTIHKAKGLEFPVVILADTTAPQGNRSGRTGILERLSGRLELSVGPHSLTCTTQGWQKAEAREQERDAAEEQRLRYVAVARARDHLIVPVPSRGKARLDPMSWVPEEEKDLSLESSSLSHSHTGQPYVYQIDSQTIRQLEQRQQDTPHFSRIGLDLAMYRTYQTWAAEQLTLRAKGRDRKEITLHSESTENSLLPEQPSHQSATAFSRRSRQHFGRVIRQALRTARQSNGGQCVGATKKRRMRKEEGETEQVLVEHILASAVFARAQAAPQYLADTPFILRTENDLIEDVIDLAFLEEGAWVLVKVAVDIGAGPELQEYAQPYQSQLLLSALALERLTSHPIKALIIFLAHSRQEVTFAWGEYERALAESLLKTPEMVRQES